MKRQRRANDIHPCLFLCCLFLLTSGCFRPQIRDYDLRAVSSPKIPLRIGLYMTPGFRTYQSSVLGLQELGEGMSRGAERAARLAFDEVVIIDSMSSAATAHQGIKAIASPEIIGAAAMENPFALRTWYQITCKWTIWTLDGKIVYMNTFRGEGTHRSFVGTTRVEISMTLAAKEQYEKFLADVVANNWWDGIK